MILFPNAKINLGLNVTSRRPDGYHDLDMVMVPVGWCDILEMVPSKDRRNHIHVTGRKVDCPPEKNLVMKAVSALAEAIGADLPGVDIHLHKVIPDGAGLGGGSSDASFALRGLNEMFSLGLNNQRLAEIASMLGSDCPFFIYNRPMLCRGTGTRLSPIEIRTGNTTSIVIAKPAGVAVSTAEAYRGVKPSLPIETTDMIVGSVPPEQWYGRLKNDFESHIFDLRPEISLVKERLIADGAVYASMSGSGSAVYGLFTNAKMAEQAAVNLTECEVFIGQFPMPAV